MMTNDIRDIIRKKKSDQPKVEPCRYYINELSEVSTEEANKVDKKLIVLIICK